MKFYSDKVSEKYRKYIIKLIFSSGESYYLLWGTDLQDEDLDYIMLNRSKQILAFTRLNKLLDYIKNNEILIDCEATKDWVNNYKNKKPYSTYKIDMIYGITQHKFDLINIGKEDAISIVDFYNLFSDYAYQTNDTLSLRMVREKNAVRFVDFFHAKFFWDSYGQEKKLEKIATEFIYSKFKNNYWRMLSSFKNQLLICA